MNQRPDIFDEDDGWNLSGELAPLPDPSERPPAPEPFVIPPADWWAEDHLDDDGETQR